MHQADRTDVHDPEAPLCGDNLTVSELQISCEAAARNCEQLSHHLRSFAQALGGTEPHAEISELGAREDRAPPIGSRQSAAVASAILKDRRRRSRIFNAGMFGEPAWEILLTLFVNDSSGLRLTVGGLSKSTERAHTTTLRWLGYLRDQKLVFREENPGDARTEFVRLTDEARRGLELYLANMATIQL